MIFKKPFAGSGHKVRNKLHWDANDAVGLQNKGKSGWTGESSFVLEVPLRYLRPSVIYSVPCDRILQRAYSPPELWPIQWLIWELTKLKRGGVMTTMSHIMTHLSGLCKTRQCESQCWVVKNRPFPSSLVPLFQNESKCFSLLYQGRI